MIPALDITGSTVHPLPCKMNSKTDAIRRRDGRVFFIPNALSARNKDSAKIRVVLISSISRATLTLPVVYRISVEVSDVNHAGLTGCIGNGRVEVLTSHSLSGILTESSPEKTFRTSWFVWPLQELKTSFLHQFVNHRLHRGSIRCSLVALSSSGDGTVSKVSGQVKRCSL